jgi:hypothetical protein
VHFSLLVVKQDVMSLPERQHDAKKNYLLLQGGLKKLKHKLAFQNTQGNRTNCSSVILASFIETILLLP